MTEESRSRRVWVIEDDEGNLGLFRSRLGEVEPRNGWFCEDQAATSYDRSLHSPDKWDMTLEGALGKLEKMRLARLVHVQKNKARSHRIIEKLRAIDIDALRQEATSE